MILIIFFITIILVLLYIEYKRTNLFFNYYNLFVIYWYFYTIGIFFSQKDVVTQNNIFATYLILLAGISFIIGYYFIPLGSKQFSDKKRFILLINNIPNLKIILFFLTLTALTFFIYVVILKIGFKDYFFTTRAHRSLLVRSYSKFMIFIDLFNLVAGLALFLYLKTKKNFYKRLFIFVFLLSMLHAILTISRNDLVLLIIPIIYILHYFNRIKTKTIIIFLISGLLIATLWKSALGELLIYKDFNIEKIIFNIKFPREFIVWQEIANHILNYNISLNGESYLKAFSNFIYPHHVENLSLWYVKNFEPHVYAIGGGRGFSNILEAYINFNILGVILIFFLLGMLIFLFQRKANRNVLFFLSYSYSLAFVHRIFRSDFVSLTKTWWWVYFISFVLLLLVFKILKNVSNANKLYNQSKI